MRIYCPLSALMVSVLSRLNLEKMLRPSPGTKETLGNNGVSVKWGLDLVIQL